MTWSPPRPALAPQAPRWLSGLLSDVQQARTDFLRARALGTPSLVRAAEAELIASLTEYTEALVSMRLPVPYALRDELRIHRDVMTGHRT